MASLINADNGVVSGSAGVKTTADSSGVLALQTNGTTALSISTAQVVSYTNSPTYTAGTANGVAYLNGSKVLTTGTALTFDGTNLSGTGSMGTTIASKTAQFNAAGGSIYASFADGTNTWRIGGGIISAGQFNLYDVTNSQTTLGFVAGAAGYSAFYQNNAEQMRLNSTGLGIGTSSPSYKLDVQGATGTTVSGTYDTSASGSSIALSRLRTTGTGRGYWDIRTGNTASGLTGALDFFDNIAGASRAILDTSGNLGLGVTPSAWTTYPALQVNRGSLWGPGSNFYVSANLYYDGTNRRYIASTYATEYEQASGQHIWLNAPSGTAGNVVTLTQAMTLNASNQLMIGTTSPSTFPYLTVANTGVDIQVISTTTTSALMDANATNNVLALRAPFNASPATTNNSGAKWGIWFSGGPPSDTTTYPYSSTQARTTAISKSAAIYAVSEDPSAGYNRTVGLAFYTSAFDAGMTQSGRFDGRGNFGIGMTPSPWGSGRTAIQVYGSSTAAYFSGGTANCIFGNNFYHNGTNDVFTNATWYAAYYAQTYLGDHIWTSSTAASVSANSAVTFNTLMTLTQAGTLLVGVTTAAAQGGLTIYPTGSAGGPLVVWNRATTASTTTAADFRNASTSVGSITYTNALTAYNTSSDYRLKNITGPITNSGAYIDSLKPVEGTWKADGSTFVGLIAHEVQEASRTVVATGTKDGEEMQGMDYSSAEIIANLIAEVQSLRVRLNSLENK